MNPSLRRANVLALLLLIPGSAAMVGHLTGNQVLKGLGMATAASPLPRVFGTAIHQETGLEFETFSARAELTYRDGAGQLVSLTPDREFVKQVRGPYNRRNAYGAAVCYSPALPPAMQQAALRYALVEPGTMRDVLKLPADAHDFRLHLKVRTASGYETLTAVLP